MKSYFLEGISSVEATKLALRARLPGQEEPWLLLAPDGDPIAYFNVYSDLDGEAVLNIQADVSGRHYNEDAVVLAVLEDIKSLVGGRVTDDS